MKTLVSSSKSRYREIDGKPAIELKLKTPQQLFDERDPAPFRERDLDDDAVRYIVSSYKEMPKDKNPKLSLYIQSMHGFDGNAEEIRRAIRSHFLYEAELKRRELRETFKHGFIALGIGLSFLLTCTWFSMTVNAEGSLFRSLMKEWLMLMGWVSTWKPISIFLYEWWPIRGSMKTLLELGEIEIDIVAAEAEVQAQHATHASTKKESAVTLPLTTISLKIS